MSMELDQAREIAERIARRVSADSGSTPVRSQPKGEVSAELAAEFPVSIDNTALQVVPDYRLRASFAIRF